MKMQYISSNDSIAYSIFMHIRDKIGPQIRVENNGTRSQNVQFRK